MKLAKTYEEQLDILKSRNLIIENRENALKVLSNVNYYNLTGYLYQFKDKNGNYINGTSFDQGVALYNFDKELHSFLLYLLTEIEQSIKTKIAYAIALAYPDNPCIYEEPCFFKDSKAHERFISDFHKNVESNKGVEFVKHHKAKYSGKFPIWVAVQLFTMGNIKHLYLNIPNKVRRQISKEFKVSPVTMDNWIEVLRILRNLSAHNIRLYGYRYKLTPRFSDLGIKYSLSNKLFANLKLLEYLYYDWDTWIERMVQLRNLIAKYSKYVELDQLGFDSKWFYNLTIPRKNKKTSSVCRE